MVLFQYTIVVFLYDNRTIVLRVSERIEMATPKRLRKEDIEKARQRLLAAIFSEQPDDRYVKKQGIKQLMSTLIAARERGMAFEKIAQILAEAGFELTVETLRSYYFELKTQDELAAQAARHARKVSETRQAIERESLDQHTAHAAMLAENYVRREQPGAKLANVFSGNNVGDVRGPAEVLTPKDEPKTVDLGRTKTASRQVAPPKQKPDAAPMPQKKPEREELAPQVYRPPMAAPRAEVRPDEATAEDAGEPLTLDEVERASNATDERTVLEEDVTLRGEYVIYASGRPFRGYLAKKQIHLLRIVGKLVAPTRGRSSKDFVAMPSKL